MNRTNSTFSPDRAMRMRSVIPTTGRRSARGFSLIELMVAIVLGLLVVAGLIDLFAGSRRAYQVQSGNNYLQENLRFASDRLSWSLRMAGFWGGNNGSAVTVNSTAPAVITYVGGDCTAAWVTAVNPSASGGGSVHGYDGSTTFPLGADCIGGDANYVKGSDVIVLRYADPQVLAPGPAEAGFAPAESSTISDNASQIFVLSTPATSAQLFAGAVPITTAAKLHRYARAYRMEMFYLRPCDVLPAGGACDASADGGHPIPTLMRMSLNGTGKLVSQAVVEGIEQLKFEYGVAAGISSGNMVPVYKTAAAVKTSALWANVVSVRVSLVAVNPSRDIRVPHVHTYTLGTLGACTYIINSSVAATTTDCPNFTPYGDKPWQFNRTEQDFVVQLRNSVREVTQ